MPGIFGKISQRAEGETTGRHLEEMCAGLRPNADEIGGRREFYGGAFGMGWSLFPETMGEQIPVLNDRQDIAMIFVGEVFGKARKLTGAELIQRFEAQGVGFLEDLNGILSGVIIDERGRTPSVHLFSDRFGLERVYVHATGEDLFFASEAKALLSVMAGPGELDEKAVSEVFTSGCTMEGRSLFKGIEIMPPGSVWTWEEGGRPSKRFYFEASDLESLSELSASDYYEKLRNTFEEMAGAYCAHEGDLALSVTGGLDSRMILAAAKPAPNSMDSYTFGGPYRECADVRLGREIAHACQQKHQVLALGDKFFKGFPTLAEEAVVLSDGVMDASGATGIHLNRMARQVAPIRLTGNYGGEILRGLTWLKAHPYDLGVLNEDVREMVAESREQLGEAMKSPCGTVIVGKQLPWHHQVMYALERSQVTVRTPFLDRALIELCFQAPAEVRSNKNLPFQFVADCAPDLAKYPNDRGMCWSPGGDLTKKRGLLKKLRQDLPPKAEYLFDYGMPDWFAPVDRALAPFKVSKLFLGIQKFTHYRLWYKNELSGYVQEMLLDERTLARPIFNAPRVRTVVEEHIRGKSNHTLTIHKLLGMELLHRNFVDK